VSVPCPLPLIAAMIAALLPPDARLQRLQTATRGGQPLVLCRSWSELTLECERGAADLVVFDLYADGVPDFERVRQLRSRAPRAAMVAYVEAARARPRDMFDAGRCGIEALIVAGEDDAPQTLVALIDRAAARGAAALVMSRLTGARPLVRDAVLLAVTRAHERLTPDTLARHAASSRRALTRRLTAATLPPPHQLITWGRLIVAARLLEHVDRSAESVARALDFPSPSAFRNTCRRYLGATPMEVRAAGGAAWVVRQLFEIDHAARTTVTEVDIVEVG
jgi:AraC-like DNA-binding protein